MGHHLRSLGAARGHRSHLKVHAVLLIDQVQSTTQHVQLLGNWLYHPSPVWLLC